MSSPSSETSTADRKQEVSSDKQRQRQRQLPLPLPFIGNSSKKKRAELPESSPWTSLDNCEQAMPAATGDAAATFLLLRLTFFLSLFFGISIIARQWRRWEIGFGSLQRGVCATCEASRQTHSEATVASSLNSRNCQLNVLVPLPKGRQGGGGGSKLRGGALMSWKDS